MHIDSPHHSLYPYFCAQDGHESCCSVPLCRSLRTACSRYRSRYHVLARLQRLVDTLLSQWEARQRCLRPPDLELERVTCPHISALDQVLFPDGGDVSDKVASAQESLRSSDPSTLYR